MAKRHLAQYDSEGRKIPLYIEANEVDVNGRPLDEVIGEGVYDPQYVHTDNNYTTAEKNKLAGLRNYDDTDVQTAIRNINDAIDRLTGTSDTTEIIDTMNEVIDFLSGLDNTDNLANELVSIRQQLANKLNANDAYNKNEVNGLLDAKQDIINDLVTIRNGARLGATAVQTETDPTVPSWAKQPRKPTYTAAEVGALPANTTIPQGTVTAIKVNNEQPTYPNASGVVSLTISASGAQVQPDWNETNTESPAYIQNKPDVAIAISVNQHSYVMNEHHAFVIPDYYTKTEVDDKVANAGKVQSVSVNGGQPVQPVNGNVNLIIEAGATGPQGPKGDTVVVSTEGLEQFGLANELDSSSTTDGLTARQGKILKGNVEALWAKVNALINDLAPMAFTGAKTQGLGNIDWTGGTFYATINKSLTGCTATDNTNNGQLAEGSTLTVQLTASGGYTLTGATISVTDSRGQAVAYTLNGSTLSVANVVGSITISVVAVAVYSVANNDTHVDLSTQTPNPVAGSSWSGTLSLKSSVTGYRLATTPSVTMGGVAVDFTATGNSWNSSTGAMTIGNVTGNIVILEAAVEIVAHTITKKLLNMTSSNTTNDTTDEDFGYKVQSVEDGGSYTTTLAAVSGATSNNDVVVKMGGVDITSTAYNSSTGVVSIAEVTGDVTIIATAATGVIKVTSNTAITGGITINGTAHDLAVGDTTINGITAITALVFSADAKTAITALDFGGATSGMSFSDKFKDFTSLTDLKGLVITSGCQTLGGAFQNCTNLETLSTIGWCPVLSYIIYLATSCAKLEALDLSGVSFLNNCDSLYSIASGCTSMAKLVLPALEVPSITDLRNMFSGSHITHVDMSGLVLTGVTNMQYMLQNAQIGTLDIRGIDTSTTGPTSLSFWSRDAVIGTLIIGRFDMARVTNIGFTTTKISRIVCTTTTPTSINPDKNWVSQQEDVQIYVPASAVEAYKAATGWSAVADRIHSINEYTE